MLQVRRLDFFAFVFPILSQLFLDWLRGQQLLLPFLNRISLEDQRLLDQLCLRLLLPWLHSLLGSWLQLVRLVLSWPLHQQSLWLSWHFLSLLDFDLQLLPHQFSSSPLRLSHHPFSFRLLQLILS